MSIGISTNRTNMHIVGFGKNKEGDDKPATLQDIKNSEERMRKYVDGAYIKAVTMYEVAKTNSDLAPVTLDAAKFTLLCAGLGLQSQRNHEDLPENSKLDAAVNKITN